MRSINTLLYWFNNFLTRKSIVLSNTAVIARSQHHLGGSVHRLLSAHTPYQPLKRDNRPLDLHIRYTKAAMSDIDPTRRNKRPRQLTDPEKEKLDEFTDQIHYSARYRQALPPFLTFLPTSTSSHLHLTPPHAPPTPNPLEHIH